MAADPVSIFTSRSQAFAQEENRFARQVSRIGWLRLFIFVGAVAGAVYLFYTDRDLAGFMVLLIGYAIFLYVLQIHTKLQYRQKHNGFLKKINTEEVERLKGNLGSFFAGQQYRNEQHGYTSDLDIFGANSLFQLLNRAVTGIGQDKLANWLQQRAEVPEIKMRQEAIAELSPDIDWRQHLQAKALHYKRTVEAPFQFFEWLQAPDFFQDKAWLRITTFLLPVLTVGFLLYSAYLTVVSYGDTSSRFAFYPAGICMLIQYLLAAIYNKQRDAYYEQSSGMYDVLRSYHDLLQHIENRPAVSQKLKEQQVRLTVAGSSASAQIHRLAKIIEYLSARMNVYISFIINAVLMWDFYWMYRLENWKKDVAGNMAEILTVIAEVEALASLSALQYAYPDYTVPQISNDSFEIEAKELGHPLLFSSSRITNNFAMAGAGHTCIITGSNMSGKSTFLRSVALNLVLAQSGAVVCARQFRFFPGRVFTAMRTEDNLAESTSSFYAELKRLRMLLDITATGEPVIYFLDEILKGTNSRDRHAGAKALIMQLHGRNTSGLVSTHDLELGAMEQEHPDYISNYSFNSTIEGDKILFDYKLKPGICRSFNASKLMQLMGIAME